MMALYIDSGFKKITSVHSRLTLQQRKCRKNASISEWTAKRKTTLIQKDLLKRDNPPKLYKDKEFTYHDENNDHTDKRKTLLLKQFLKGPKGCSKGTRGTHDLLYIEQHIHKKALTKQKNVAMVYSVWKYKISVKCHGKLEVRVRTILRCGKNPKTHLPERVSLISSIHYSNDGTHEVHRKIQIIY